MRPALSLRDGRVFVLVRDQAIAPGVVVRALDLEVPDVAFPVDLRGGAARFQHHPTRLVSAAIEVDPAALAAALTRRLPPEGAARGLSAVGEGGVVVTEARLTGPRGARVRERSRHVVMPGRGRALRVLPVERVRIGGAGVPEDAVARALVAAAAALPGARALALEVDAQGALSLDVLAAALWAVLPRAGWKLPAHDGVGPARAFVTAEGRLWFAHGPEPMDLTLPLEDGDGAREALRAHAREDALELATPPRRAGSAPASAVDRFLTLRAALDGRLGPPELLERVLLLGVSEPELHVDTADLVSDALALQPGSPVAWAVRADLADARGDVAEATHAWAESAQAFTRAGQLRLAGLAHLAIADRAQGPDRASSLEAALAVLGDDPEVLRALVEDLIAARQPAAVSMARRLARAAATDVERAWAHVAAGDVLRVVMSEPIAAKREYERALLVDPDDTRALEGLAAALSAQGDPRRAAALLERLFTRAMAAGDRARAAALSVSLGDLWQPLDWSAAVARWRRASELDPAHLPALERLARAAAEAPDDALAIEAGERALALGRKQRDGLTAELERELRLRAARIAARTPGGQAEALGHAEALLARAPDDPEALELVRAAARALGREGVLARALAHAADERLERGDVAGAASLVREEAAARSASGPLAPGERAALVQRAEAVLAEAPGDDAALDALITVDERPGARARALRARIESTRDDGARPGLALALAEALADDGDPHGALAVAASVVPQRVEAAEWVALAGALADTAVAGEIPRLLALAAAHATPEGAPVLARAEAVARERIGDLAGAYEARARVLDAGADGADLAEVTRLALRLERHADARAWLAMWERALGPRPADRAEWLTACADAARAAGDGDGEIAALERLLDQIAAGHDTRGVMAHADVVAARLAARLAQAGRNRALAALERRRATALGAPTAAAIHSALAAAEAWTKVGDEAEAVRDLDRVLEWGAALPTASAQVAQALDALEKLARRRGDPARIVEALDRRARFVIGPEARARVRLEQAEVLEDAGAPSEAIARLEQARAELPRSRAIAARLAREAKRLGLLELWAASEAHLAALADDEGDRAAAVEQHAVAAAALAETGRLPEAALHDRVVVERGMPELRGPETSPLAQRVERSLRRLERHARATRDDVLLDEVLERWAELDPPVAAVERLYEKAELELARRGPTDRALAALRRARSRAEDDVPRARELDARIAELLTALERWEELAAHAVARGDRADGPRRAAAYLEAARVLDERLGQRSSALERTRAALEADPSNPSGRALRRRLLRETARGTELAEALLEDAGATAHAEEQASLRLEAADILAPIDDDDVVPSTAALLRALDIGRDVARGAPRWAAPYRRVAHYARLLARFDEEYVALGRLADITDDAVERALAVWRRVELARGPLEDPIGAQAELHDVIQTVEGLDPERAQRMREQLARTPSIVRPDGVEDPLDALLALGTALTAETRDFETHLRYLARQLARAPDPRTRADLHFRIGETREWKMGDGDAAERAYLAALRELPEHERTRKALRGLYLAVDRFGDLAEHLGIEELLSLWTELAQSFAGERQIAAGEALWPRLPRGSAERARVLLATADLYRTTRDEAEGAVMLLELVTREGPAEFEPAALERLRVLFLEEGRNDLYLEILRRQADRAEGDVARARALAEVGEALEWKLGDGAGAELEYRTALAADPACALARERLGLLLASQDRFEELAADLGAETLEREALALASRGRREGPRLVRAADVLATILPEPRRAALWGELIEREPDPELRRKLMSYGPVSSIGAPEEEPPAWDEGASATHFELPAVPPEAVEVDVDPRAPGRPRAPVRLTVVGSADPLAEVVRLVPRAAEPSVVVQEQLGRVVPLNREDAERAGEDGERADPGPGTPAASPSVDAPPAELGVGARDEWTGPVRDDRIGPDVVSAARTVRRRVDWSERGPTEPREGATELRAVDEPEQAAPLRDAALEPSEVMGTQVVLPDVDGTHIEPPRRDSEEAWDVVMARVPLDDGAGVDVDLSPASRGEDLEVPSAIEEAEPARLHGEVALLRPAARPAADDFTWASWGPTEAQRTRAMDEVPPVIAAARASRGEPAPESAAPAPSEGPPGEGAPPEHPAAPLLRPSASPPRPSSPPPRPAAVLPPRRPSTVAPAPHRASSPLPPSAHAPARRPTLHPADIARPSAPPHRASAPPPPSPLREEALEALGTPAARALLYALRPDHPAAAPLRPLSATAHAPAAWRALVPLLLDDPLAALLARTAMPVAAVLPPRGADVTARHSLDEASPLARTLPALARALDLRLSAERDGAVRGIHLDPGEPPTLVLGPDVAGDGRGTYLLASAAMRVRLGALLADAPDLHAWLRTLVHLLDLRPDEDPATGLLRARLGPSGLADVEALAEAASRRTDPASVAAWAVAVRRAAAVFGALWSGTAAPLLDEPDAAPGAGPGLIEHWLSEPVGRWIASLRSEG